MKIVRIYVRVSSDSQDIERQEYLVGLAKSKGFCIAEVYAEKSSGASFDRPELNRMLDDLQPGDTILVEDMDRIISRLPLVEAEKLAETIKKKGAKILIPGLLDWSELGFENKDIVRGIFEGIKAIEIKNDVIKN